MSIEGLWTARFGHVEAPNEWRNGGVVIFETGRVLGGDGGTFYIGDAVINNDIVTANFIVRKYDERYITAFGDIDTPLNVIAEGKRVNDIIAGTLTADGLSILFDLTKRCDLP